MYREEDLKSTSYATTKRLFPCVLGLMLALLSAPAFGQGDIHELQYNNFEWVDTDVSAAGGGQEASTGIAAIYTTPNDQRHVYYESPDLDIHQLYFNGSSWSDDDLSVVTDGQQGSDNTAVSAFSIGNAQYVYFCGADSAVHELTYGNNGNFSWVDIALPTGGSEGGCPNSVNGMVAFATSPNNQRHVYFRQDGNPSIKR